jgi:flagella basal body P-ring formation protein FlgA
VNSRLALIAACAALAGCPGLGAQPLPGAGLPAEAAQQALALAAQAAQALAPAGARIRVSPGALNPRLQLAACGKVVPALSPGQPAWGRTRIGLRCQEGTSRWSVSLPVTVEVWAPAVVLATALPAGATLDGTTLAMAEVDWGAAAGKPFADSQALLGRVLARPLAAGQAPRSLDLLARKWFASGETVQIVARGPGFAVSAEGQALTHGLEGQPARVRTDNGRVVVGRPVAERRMEVQL